MRGWLAAASLVYGAGLTLLRGRPTLGVDAGVFLSVAARLLHGDRLYTQVWDNKDPLFFYTDAAALWVAGWRGPFLLDVLWLAVAAAAMVLLLRTLGSPWPVQLAGFVAYPLLLTGQWYDAGYSMLAALAAAPVASWLWARGNATAAGAVVAVGALFKVSLLLILAAGPLALLAVGVPAGARTRHVGRGLTGLLGVGAIAAAVLAGLGELRAYVDLLRENASYASRVLRANGRPAGIHGHVRVAETATAHARPLIAVFALACLAAAVVVARGRRERPLAALVLVVAVATGLTLALTAAWSHHVQMAAYPGALLAVAAVAALERARTPLVARLGLQAAALAALVWLIGGAAIPKSVASSWFHTPASKTARALDAVRAQRLPRARVVTYARLGQNDEEAHAAFLHGDWQLACARFHQYPFSSPASFAEVDRCLVRKRPELVLVTSSLSPREHAPRAWDSFIAASKALLRENYRRVYFLRHRHGTIAVWQLRG